MDLENIIPIIIAFVTAFLLPFFLSKRKKEGHKKFEEFRRHLLGIGVGFAELDKESEQAKLGKKISRAQKSEGVFALEEKNIDFIIVTSVASQYGVNYFIEYFVKSTFHLREESLKKTKMVKKKGSLFGSKVADIIWKGDQYLAQKLNLDYELKHRLLQAGLNKFKGSILIIPERKHGYTRIKTEYNLPSPDMFYAIDSVAKYLRSGI
ncbi:MAG: hypothetical protein GTN73_09235 [Candidatus Aminicenantes bacterium]|nr:hypothetical protein [Candidatus Aminicenantes bacterium]